MADLALAWGWADLTDLAPVPADPAAAGSTMADLALAQARAYLAAAGSTVADLAPVRVRRTGTAVRGLDPGPARSGLRTIFIFLFFRTY